MPFEHTVTVRFQDVDRAGIAFFGRVFDYCHAVFEELLVAAGDSLSDVFATGFGMPLVHCDSDFSRPMRMGERLRVVCEVERVGSRSVTFAYALFGPEGELRAKARLVHATVILETMTGCPVPERILEPLRTLDLIPG